MLTIKKLKSFIVILVLSGSNQLLRQEMYLQRREDNQNRMVTALMTKNEFEESKHFFHLADNENLDKTDRLFDCRLVCYQTLVWFKKKKLKKNDLVLCFTCTLLLLA